MDFEINLIFLINSFFHHMSWQKPKYLENEKSFLDEIKSIFHYFWRAFNEALSMNFIRGWESDFSWDTGAAIRRFSGFLTKFSIKQPFEIFFGNFEYVLVAI